MVNTSAGYGDARAELYDQLLYDLDRRDAAFYADLARNVDGAALELACGTGRIYLDLLSAGIDADGIDVSADMLSILRQKANRAGLEPSVWRADVTDFAVGREYGLLYCPFNALQHLVTIEDQLAALRCAHDALAPGGRFVFDVFVPSFDLIAETYGEWHENDVEFRGAEHRHRKRTRIVDEIEQRFEVETELYDPDGERVFSSTDHLKMLPKREIELLARRSPFDEWSVAGGFDGAAGELASGDDTIEDGDTIQVWTLRKAD
ncbi:Methyltransferase domain-containing protein [Natronoarchaeum philippinense]|uniref:Methyltransferase domain-containing protein n=1 Tax=Natronoarchaeum philippinense TaxID=558529 RepID=A0A285N0B1_NATPI|nr:class I SAM-dependent methyltransferase [Natronoarchaeum philippinense]SNZ02894.1 Methyltransferase domain-containing protein [Natronoarchaeum philippinense]